MAGYEHIVDLKLLEVRLPLPSFLSSQRAADPPLGRANTSSNPRPPPSPATAAPTASSPLASVTCPRTRPHDSETCSSRVRGGGQRRWSRFCAGW